MAWLVPCAVYFASLNRSISFWDTGEMQVVPWILGIAHPTGFPAFTLFGFAFAHALPFGPVAARMAFMSALCAATTAWLVWRTVVDVGDDPWAGCGAALVFAFGEVVWLRGTRTEVHTFALVLAIGAVYFAQRWYRSAKPADLYAAAATWGVGVATHPIDVLVAPALVVLIGAHVRRATPRSLLVACLIAFAGVALYAYLPLRSAYVTHARIDPTLALGEQPGKPFWDNDHPSSLSGFVQEVSGSDFGAGESVARMLDWKTYAENVGYLDTLVREATPAGVAFAFVGAFALLRKERVAGVALILAGIVPTAFGFAYTIEADRLRYDLIGFATVAMFAGFGVAAIGRSFPALRSLVLGVLFVTPAALLVWHASIFEQRNSLGAQPTIDAVRARTPNNAVLVAPWLFATPLAYAAYVDHSLGHRVVETAWLSDDADLVPRWMRTRPVYVVGLLFGSVPGYDTRKVSSSPDIWQVVKR